MSSAVQHIRLRRPEPQKPKEPPAPRHAGILQDQLRRAQRRPWSPTFSFAVRLLLLVRITGAMYSNIDDCDEVFNFWEPLHLLDKGYGFQTWELSPRYAIRSWAYLLLHILPSRIVNIMLGGDKRASFFAVRVFLALGSVLAEAKLYRAVYERVNERVGRYLFFMLLFSSGMWNASAALLPSSFAMYTTTLAYSYAMAPASNQNARRTLVSTLLFATGALVGWPFSLALAVPFVVEELFIYGADTVPAALRWSWMVKRWTRLLSAGLISLVILVPVVGIDSVAYGELVVVPWNIVRYNIFGGERGPDLYGTSPWSFYLLNLVLNFNVLTLLALISLPALVVTYFVDRKRLGFFTPTSEQSSPFTILALRLFPFYLWLGILTAQAHKEERFMFPAYPLLCLNAAIALYLIRGWQETAFIAITKSPYRASQTSLFSNFTFSVIVGTALISASRVVAMWHYYHSPMSVMFAFETTELPRLLNVTGLLPVYPEGTPEDHKLRIDLSPIHQFALRLCLAKDWHRFPGHYLVPEGVRVDFVQSDFHGMLPAHFENPPASSRLPSPFGPISAWWPRPQTRYAPPGLNDLNREESSYYVPVEDCDYLLDLDFPLHPTSSPLEPRYVTEDETWERVSCAPFLDARHSHLLTRTLWMPGEKWHAQNEFGEYCLLKNKVSVSRKEERVAKAQKPTAVDKQGE